MRKRLSEVIAARKFNEKLLEELGANYNKDYGLDTGIFIGRFQPLHKGHIADIEYMIKRCAYPIVFVGSSDKHGTDENPYHVADRIKMIRSVFMDKYPHLKIYALPDTDTDTEWMNQLKEVLSKVANKRLKDVKVFFHDKHEDHKTIEYKGMVFPNIPFSKIYEVEGMYVEEVPNSGFLVSGTDIRKNLEANKQYLDPRVYDIINTYDGRYYMHWST